MSKRGRKPGSGASVSAAEVDRFWGQFRFQMLLVRNKSDEIKRNVIEKLALKALYLLLEKGENLPKVKAFRQKQREMLSPEALQKQLAGELGVTRQALYARKKRKDKKRV